ncbi:MAG: glycosyltransferase [Firmicutes bacterium]|nr:glycosyltransferase [Bacillota bacterium]
MSRKSSPGKKINILYLIASLDSGGAERQVIELARSLDKSRYNVFIVIYHNRIHFKEIQDAPGITLTVLEKKFKYDPRFPFRLAYFCKQNKIDIIHAYSESAGFWGRLAGKLAGVPSITHIQNTNYSPSFFRGERLMGWMDTEIIANSYAGRDEYKRGTGRDIPVIQNGMNLDLIPENIAKSVYPKKFRIISAGRISKQKNYLCLLKGINEIRNQIPGLIVEIWGRVMHRNKLEEIETFIKERHLENIVFLKSASDQIIKEIAESDLLVMTSLWEGFPNVVMEALACKTPVISSDVADLSWLVRNGETGFLFPSDDYNALAQRILEFYRLTSEKRLEMGEKGRKHIGENYTTAIMAQKTGAIYDKITEAQRTATE